MKRNQILRDKCLFVERAIKVMGENRRDLLAAKFYAASSLERRLCVSCRAFSSKAI